MGFWDVGPFDNSAARDLLDDVREGRFNMDRFKFDCAGEDVLDADDAAAVIALHALVSEPASRPCGVTDENLGAAVSPGNAAWLWSQRRKAVDPERSALYAYWESAGELDEWLQATRRSGASRSSSGTF